MTHDANVQKMDIQPLDTVDVTLSPLTILLDRLGLAFLFEVKWREGVKLKLKIGGRR